VKLARFSKRADSDIEDIATFTIERWGSEQARAYVFDLRKMCRDLAALPDMGRSASKSRLMWRRFEHRSHVILYAITTDGITVQRILHKAQLLPKR
jgi:toxin ParE1/3/4